MKLVGIPATEHKARHLLRAAARACCLLPALLVTPFAFADTAPVVGTVNITTSSIFDLTDPQEDKPLYRFANRAHVTTRAEVVRQQLLFKPGDPFSARALEESERILRSNGYILDAIIEPAPSQDGVVDINVRTTDVWTLIPKISFSRSGGTNGYGIGAKEMNLFGTGATVDVRYKSNIDRDSTVLKFADRNLGDSWYSLSALYANNSDGHSYGLELGQPFYSLDSRAAHGINLLNYEQIDPLYDRGEIVSQFRNQSGLYEAFKGWSGGLNDGWTRRFTAGVGFEDRRFSAVDPASTIPQLVPEDRKFVYPFVSVEFVEDRFEKTANQDQINRIEDRYLGTRFGLKIAAAREEFGSSRNAWLVNAGAQTSIGSTRSTSTTLATNVATRIEDGTLQNFSFDVAARFYHKQSDARLFYASLTGVFGHNLDIDQQLLLGGDNGLRGYPLRYQTGDKRMLLTLEQRFFTKWYPFRLFNVGAAVFFDAGRAWGYSPVSDLPNEVLRDVGVGLRIGNTRSGQGHVIHVDVAYPLDGDQSIKSVQLLISAKNSF